MAGDWIKMRSDLEDDPAVISIAAATQCVDEDHVVGKLKRFWSWVDRQSRDGNAAGVTLLWIDHYVGVTGFAQALVDVGWLEVSEAGIRIPNFERHMSQSAKARALTAKRAAKNRSRSRNAPSVTRALPEKRREEKSISSKEEIEGKPQSGGSLPAEQLLDKLIDQWNSLPSGMAPKIKQRRSKGVVAGWKAVQRDPERRAAFADPIAVISAVREAKWAHAQSFWSLAWLFKGDRGEANITKLMEGRYRGDAKQATGADSGRFEDRKPAGKLGGDTW